MKRVSSVRKSVIVAAMGTLACASLVGCETPATQPQAAPGTTATTAVNKPATGDTGGSAVSEKPTMNPAFTGGTGSKLK